MKKPLQCLVLASAVVSTYAFATDTAVQPTLKTDSAVAKQNTPLVQAELKKKDTIVTSPRTGIRYSLGDTGDRPIVMKTTPIAPATAANVNRIVASNPALSTVSQEKAKTALIGDATTSKADTATLQANADTEKASGTSQ